MILADYESIYGQTQLVFYRPYDFSLIMFTIEFCKTKKGYEAKPSQQLSLDLSRLIDLKGFSVITDAGIAVVGTISDEEVLIQSYGNILFKTLDVESDSSKGKAKKIAKKIYGVCL